MQLKQELAKKEQKTIDNMQVKVNNNIDNIQHTTDNIQMNNSCYFFKSKLSKYICMESTQGSLFSEGTSKSRAF